MSHLVPEAPSALQLRVGAIMNHQAMNLTVAFLIVLSVILLFLENLYPRNAWLFWAGDLVTFLFVFELGARYYAARSKRAYFRTYWIDLLSLLSLVSAFRAFRALRLLRLLRIGSLIGRTNRRVSSAVRQAFGAQLFIINLIFITVVTVSLALLTIEYENEAFDTMSKTTWWALLSMIAGEPIGEMPVTFMGRVLTLVIMVGGLTVFALFVGTVSAVMAERLRDGAATMDLEELRDHIIVCGWNRSGRLLLEELEHSEETRDKHMVVVAEQRPEFGSEIDHDPHIHFLAGDYTSSGVLKRAGIHSAASAVLLADKTVAARSDQDRDARTVLAALMMERLQPGIFICAELLSRDNEQHLIMAGIEEIVITDEFSATILATSSRVRGVTEIADEIFSNKYGNRIYKRPVKPEWVGKQFIDVQRVTKLEYNALLLAIEQAGVPLGANPPGATTPRDLMKTNPPADYILKEGDRLVLLAQEGPLWQA